MNRLKKYKGRVMRPTMRHTVGFKPVTRWIGSKDMAAACDGFWQRRGIREPIGNFHLCES